MNTNSRHTFPKPISKDASNIQTINKNHPGTAATQCHGI
ncbi:hypothetical protein E1A91_D04G015700v1 [Gossypium mustelinum]|uniref:Uncharacterized protein n=1 Tax=Gossypium mustelinum TaxID=34275 RepID=A0A5D2V8M7_GOSMU|nr:hypothetical protein E1A91_D04G015700v1 [Gossypium mustelinum]